VYRRQIDDGQDPRPVLLRYLRRYRRHSNRRHGNRDGRQRAAQGRADLRYPGKRPRIRVADVGTQPIEKYMGRGDVIAVSIKPRRHVVGLLLTQIKTAVKSEENFLCRGILRRPCRWTDAVTHVTTGR